MNGILKIASAAAREDLDAVRSFVASFMSATNNFSTFPPVAVAQDAVSWCIAYLLICARPFARPPARPPARLPARLPARCGPKQF
jgi:hypothetical protein